MTIAFLHTAPVHVRTFTELVDTLAPGTPTRHVVDESLLADARAGGGVDAGLTARLGERLAEAAADAAVVVCTCSTLAGPAEDLGPVAGVPILRIDRPMAVRAVADGGPILVVAAVDSTLAPTTDLLGECSGAAGSASGTRPEVRTLLVDGAWAAFEAGDTEGYEARIAEAVLAELGPEPPVVVLAQASMAGAADRIVAAGPDGVTVLSSPRSAVEAALALAEGSAGGPDRA